MKSGKSRLKWRLIKNRKIQIKKKEKENQKRKEIYLQLKKFLNIVIHKEKVHLLSRQLRLKVEVIRFLKCVNK